MENISCSGLPLPKVMKKVIESFGEYYGGNIPWNDLRSMDFVEKFDEKRTQFLANIMADGLAADIAEKKKTVDQGRRMSCRTRGNCRPLIEAPDKVQELWAGQIAHSTLPRLSTSWTRSTSFSMEAMSLKVQLTKWVDMKKEE